MPSEENSRPYAVPGKFKPEIRVKEFETIPDDGSKSNKKKPPLPQLDGVELVELATASFLPSGEIFICPIGAPKFPPIFSPTMDTAVEVLPAYVSRKLRN